MATKLNRLSARTVATISKPGRHADGGNLYLDVSPSGAKSWAFMWSRGGRQREMGLGALNSVPQARARELAAAARAAIAEGRDPLTERNREKAKTFGECADAYIAAMGSAWRNEKHRAQWKMTLTEYAGPIRKKPVAEVGFEDVLRVLKPIWSSKPETASRLRGRIENVLNYAKTHGWRSGENPAAWRGNLSNVLPARGKLTRGHHAAMAVEDAPAFIGRLRASQAVSARALEFAILTAARTGEVIGAKWSEITEGAGLWTVPAERMKAGVEHRVPLCDRATEILAEMKAIQVDERASAYVFAGPTPGKGLSNMAMDALLRRLKVDVTVHGFRSTFRDWVSERTHFTDEVAEMALAHTIGDKTEAAYRRGDLLAKRREMMDAWSRFCDQATATVLPFSSRIAV